MWGLLYFDLIYFARLGQNYLVIVIPVGSIVAAAIFLVALLCVLYAYCRRKYQNRQLRRIDIRVRSEPAVEEVWWFG